MPDVLRASAVYRPQHCHARGGQGEVLAAHQEELDRTVALKRIRPEMLHVATRRHRFLREAAITAQLQHPGIVPIYGLGEDDGRAILQHALDRGPNAGGGDRGVPQRRFPPGRRRPAKF